MSWRTESRALIILSLGTEPYSPSQDRRSSPHSPFANARFSSLFHKAEWVSMHKPVMVRLMVNHSSNGNLRPDYDPLVAVDERQSAAAAEIQRGVCRALRALGHSVVTELSLSNGRRADVVGLSSSGDIWIVEIKSCLLDFQTDGKWIEYRPHCDRLYFAVSRDFPCQVIPDDAGLMLADRYGAHLVREPMEERLGAARRKAMMLCFARAAALRLRLHLDPGCGFEI